MSINANPFVVSVSDTIRKYGMLSGGERVVVAVSGGPDSVCLLNVLHALSPDFDLTLHIAHLDHMFRGKESAAEARFVAELAARLGIPATIEAIDAAAYCREHGLAAQAGAREVRYGFLERVAAETAASRIATGHTADDQAETMLLRLLRGAGLSGLSGIPPVRGNIIRPLIERTKTEVLEYVRTNALECVSDSSNVKTVYARNRIRLELIPLLKQFNPRIVETLAAEASLLRDDDEAAEARVGEIADSVILHEEDRIVLVRGTFAGLPGAWQRRLLRTAVQAAGGASELSFIQTEEALSFVSSAQSGRRLNLPGGVVIEREYERFIISIDPGSSSYVRPVQVPGTSDIPEAGLCVHAAVSGPAGVHTDVLSEAVMEAVEENYFWQAQFDYDKINATLQVRSRLNGDWFCPSGMGGKRKKLQDFFVDLKVPRRRRDLVPLLAAGSDILWVIGFRTDERFRPAADTKRILTVSVKSTRNEPPLS